MPAEETPACLLVIPCYRDSARLRPFLESLAAGLPAAFTILVVDDGSGAAEARSLVETVRAVRDAAPAGGPQIKEPLLLEGNRGKGAAVRAGWMSGGDFDLAAFADADGSVSAAEILRGYDFLRARLDNLDGILASRLAALGRTVRKRWIRHVCGRIFATAVTTLSGLPYYDTQCGFKLIKAEALKPLLPRLRSDRFSFDVELLLELRAAGARLREFPVDWVHQPGSKISMFRDAPPMLLDVWRASRRVRRSR
jgi:glycosyltransferase involved in cell wall biosynthesis